jgi:GT2 family glycosyltransferase
MLTNSINISIVRYGQSSNQIASVIRILRQSDVVDKIWIIDNSLKKETELEQLEAGYIYTGKNLGFGKAHNIAIRESINCNAKYHAVINSDIAFEPDILKQIIARMDESPDVAALMPKVLYPDGKIQHLCKLIPTPADLFVRRFLPAKWTRKRMDTFELVHSGYDREMNIPYLSGCFMVLRIAALKKTGLFDERFFLYPEDLDLSRRLHEHYRTLFYPNVCIVHAHEQGSYKSLKLLWIHVVNLIRYFNKWGWIIDKKRDEINKCVLATLPSKND